MCDRTEITEPSVKWDKVDTVNRPIWQCDLVEMLDATLMYPTKDSEQHDPAAIAP
jgi:hypothetical protein